MRDEDFSASFLFYFFFVHYIPIKRSGLWINRDYSDLFASAERESRELYDMAKRRVSFNGKIVMGTKVFDRILDYVLFLKGLTTFLKKFHHKIYHSLDLFLRCRCHL